MKRFLLSLLLPVFLAPFAQAQTTSAPAPDGSIQVFLKNGTTLASSGVRRSGANVIVSVRMGSTGSSETGYPVSGIESITFPEPPGLRLASEKLAANDAKSALGLITPVVKQQGDFKDIPGNRWAQAVAVEVRALVALDRLDDATREVDALAKQSGPEVARDARLQLALGLAKKGELGKAMSIFDEAINQSTEPSTQAAAWVAKGQAALAAKDYDSALISFLRVPIFYSEQKTVMPDALLGAGRAYLRIDERSRAIDLFKQVVSTYPGSPAAAAAQSELKELGGAS